MSIKEYVESFGYKVSDLTEEEINEVQSELDLINGGEKVLDSVLDNLGYRK